MSRPKIFLCEDTSAAGPDVYGKTLCVYHKAYKPPEGDWAAVPFDHFKADTRELIRGLDSLIFVGMTRAITSGNRTEMVFEILHNKTKELHKVSVDTHLFRGEPWRAWFHFGYAGVPYRDYTYSYIAESHWKSFIDGVRAEDPFSLGEILLRGRDAISSDHGRFFDDVSVETIGTTESIRREYEQLKARCFEEEITPSGIIRRLGDFAQSVAPGRSLPSYARLFGSRRHELVVTDLAVDRWLLARTLEVVSLTNGIAEGFSHAHCDGRV